MSPFQAMFAESIILQTTTRGYESFELSLGWAMPFSVVWSGEYFRWCTRTTNILEGWLFFNTTQRGNLICQWYTKRFKVHSCINVFTWLVVLLKLEIIFQQCTWLYAKCFCSGRIIDMNWLTVSIKLITKTMKSKIKLLAGAFYWTSKLKIPFCLAK